MTLLHETPHTRFTASSFAPQPAEDRGLARDEVRLLVATPDGLSHGRFRDLPDHLRAGDVLVVNTSATVAAEVDADLDGRPVVVHVAHRLDDGDAVVELRTAPDAARAAADARARARWCGSATYAWSSASRGPAGPSSPTGTGNRLWRASVRGDLDRQLDWNGRPIAYGYLDRRYPLEDYQTVFGTRPGSAEMASAARPFTHELVTRLVTAGVQLAPVTLHTGVSSQEAGEAPGPEWFEVTPTTARVVNQARANGGRVVAVGTTATRAVESTRARVDRRRRPRVDGPGRHARRRRPGSSTASSPAGTTRWPRTSCSSRRSPATRLTQAAYDAAVAEGYLWHEFGDSALLLRR